MELANKKRHVCKDCRYTNKVVSTMVRASSPHRSKAGTLRILRVLHESTIKKKVYCAVEKGQKPVNLIGESGGIALGKI